ncbi:MAG: class II fructose-bisphosphatase [Acidimicrobiales bacterium]
MPDRNLALELVRVTEAAAMASARWIGRGRKNDADQAAVDGMRLMLDTVAMDGIVVIGEGEKDHAPMLYNGERVGSGEGGTVDVAVDPLEGTELTAMGLPNAISVIAASQRGTMFFPPSFYLEKIAVGPEAAAAVDIRETPAENVRRIAEARRKSPKDVTVVVLNRERHRSLIRELRDDVGAKVHLIPHGDTAPAIAAARGDGDVDAVIGVGGGTEGVLAAAAIKCLGGAIQCRLWPRDDRERAALDEAGHDLGRVLHTNDLVAGDDVFVAVTGVTAGALVDGVRITPDSAVTDSLVMRSLSGTRRRIIAEHSLDKLEGFTGRRFHDDPREPG